METITLRASAMPRTVICPGSVRLESLVPPAPDTDDSKNGTAAHELSEMVLNQTVTTGEELIDRQMTNGVVVTDEMVRGTAMYIDHVRSRGLPLYIERTDQINIGHGVIVHGTTDCAAIDDVNGILYIDDLKFGWRLVEADDNWQLICYALILFNMLAVTNPTLHQLIQNVVLTIIQPNPEHPLGKIRTVTLTRDQLSDRLVLLTQFSKAIAGGYSQCQTSDKCRDCAALHSCPAAQSAGMNAVDCSGQAVVATLSPEELASELRTLTRAKDMLTNRLSALTDMTRDFIANGQSVPGWGIQESYGHRAWNKGIDATMLESLGGTGCTEHKMVTPAKAERNGVPKEMVKAFTNKPFIGNKLVPMDTDAIARKVLG